MKDSGWKYMVKTGGRMPVLCRYKDGRVYTYYPEQPEPWTRTPAKDAVLFGDGDFAFYDDITEEEAEAYAEEIRAIRCGKE